MRVSVAALLSILPGALSLGLLVPLQNAGDPKAIPGEYVIVYKKGITDLQKQGIVGTITQTADSFLRHNYSITEFNGLGARLSTLALSLLRLRTDSVRYWFLLTTRT